MSNSTDDTKELDSYGVWVKRAPQDASEEALDLDLPDFSDFQETADQTGIIEEQNDNEVPVADQDSSATDENGEISIDDFITDGFTDPNEAYAPSSPNPPEQDGELSLDDFMEGGFEAPSEGSTDSESASESDEVSLDDFLDGDFSDGSGASSSDEISIDDFLDDDSVSSAKQKEDDITNDEPLDIDVDFTESEEDAVPTTEITEENESENEESFADDDDMFDSIEKIETASEPEAETPVTESNIELEDVSLDDFNLEESDDATAAALGASINSSVSSGEETVSLDSFGIDSSSEEMPAGTGSSRKQQTVDYELAITEEDNVQSAPVIDEIKSDSVTQNKEETTETTVNNELLEKIVSDLSGLKDEINSLKNDLAELKEKNTLDNISSGQNDGEQPAESEIELPVQSEPAEEPGGFFNSDEEDDTIALSGDELSNIVSNADFTEETAEPDTQYDESTEETVTEEQPEQELPEDFSADFSNDTPFGGIEDTVIPDEEPDTGLSMDINEEILEEPNLDDIETNADIPEEIEIPKVDDIAETQDEEPALDDILVESSSTDFMDSVTDSTNMQPDIEITEPVEPELAEEEAAITKEEADDITSEYSADTAENTEPVLDEDAALELPEESSSDAENTAEESTDDIFNETAIEDAQHTQDAMMNDIMNEAPSVDNALSEENVDYLSKDNTVLSDDEAAVAESEPEPSAETEQTDTSDLPSDIKEDVKSVLLYMDQLLENLPEDKIMEFAKSEQFTTYKKLFNELGLS
ncbi:MAG: hypothetical protein MR662_03985 [Treponema porcinum]|uniref:hypothetical protein n=2 Tax=Treponema porcinum TaxID=261392 RepID=UPI002356B58D|nr:hypothetical protein [Treponema porcinum]MCI6179634.1 hypothetical protein [Treponema porcinum]MCI6815040.1 hypothetical protein [Treponema porcinum]MCI6983771.1 hypothetical protein [Treponema porcinum]MCI7533956.1 hypothetical protein [Treponema porcinum]MCI7546216.1 hypothetical protein [Treponema porcinum]